MPRGIPINKVDREHVQFHVLELEKTAGEIFAELFNNNFEKISFSYLHKLCCHIRTSNDFSESYILGPYFKPGRKSHLSVEERMLVIDIALENPTWTEAVVRKYFIESFYANQNINHLSLSTVHRIINKADITRKVTERRHILRDDVQGLEYLQRIAHENPYNLIDIDEVSSNPDSFQTRYGRSYIGERCIVRQIVIGTRSFSTIAAMTPFGFLCWQIFEGIIRAEHFCLFLDNVLQPYLTINNWCLLDNAAQHHTEDTRAVLERVMRGQYYYAPPYSPHLKPVERGFQLIKEWVRAHEIQAI